jgi:hypothetical protein
MHQTPIGSAKSSAFAANPDFAIFADSQAQGQQPTVVLKINADGGVGALRMCIATSEDSCMPSTSLRRDSACRSSFAFPSHAARLSLG